MLIALTFKGTSIVEILNMPEMERKNWASRAGKYQEMVKAEIDKSSQK